MKQTTKFNALAFGFILLVMSLLCSAISASAQVDTSAVTRMGLTRSTQKIDSIDVTSVFADRRQASHTHIWRADSSYDYMIPRYDHSAGGKAYYICVYKQEICRVAVTGGYCNRRRQYQRFYEKARD